jgi:hypothetical protein
MSEFSLEKLYAYKVLMNYAKAIKQEAFDAGWMLKDHGDGEYGMLNMEEVQKELDKKQGDGV